MKDKVSSFYKDAVTVVDGGLRKYMQSVFSHMFVGLALTAVVSYAVSTSSALMSMIFGSGLVWLVMFAPLGIVIYLSTRISKISAEAARAWFYGYAALIGISLAPTFIVYTGESIASVFFITSAMFLAMVIYGYTTDKDLTSMGSFLFMGLIGLIIASIVNIFLGNSTMHFVLSIIGVIIFTGLTAWDAQLIKSYYLDSDDGDVSSKKAIFGALQLYLDFINLFLYVLRLLGSRKN